MKKDKGLKIFFAPIGTAIRFKKDKISRHDGTEEYYKILKTLVRNPSIDEIWLLQKSDWEAVNDVEKIEYDPRKVIRDVYSEFKSEGFIRASVLPKINDPENDINDGTDLYKNLYNFLVKKKIKFDFGITFMGMGYFTNVTIPELLRSSRSGNGDGFVRVRWVTYNYTSPIIHFLNMNYEGQVGEGNCKNTFDGKTLKYFGIATDPRYINYNAMRMRDTFNIPTELISQFDYKLRWESYDNYETAYGKTDGETIKSVNLVYTGIEKSTRIGTTPFGPDNDRKTKFMIIAMQASYGESSTDDPRYNTLKKYVLDHDVNQEIEIYGKWNTYFREKCPQIKGFISSNEVDNKLKDTRYTLIIPIGNDWVTGKFFETLSMGIVPFLADTYDTQHHLLKADHFLRAKSGADLRKKMDYLDEHPDKRIALVKKLQDHFLKDTESGMFIYDIFNKAFERNEMDLELKMEQDETVIRKPKSKMLF